MPSPKPLVGGSVEVHAIGQAVRQLLVEMVAQCFQAGGRTVGDVAGGEVGGGAEGYGQGDVLGAGAQAAFLAAAVDDRLQGDAVADVQGGVNYLGLTAPSRRSGRDDLFFHMWHVDRLLQHVARVR